MNIFGNTDVTEILKNYIREDEHRRLMEIESLRCVAEVEELKRKHAATLAELELKHKLVLLEKDFEKKHHKDEELLKAKEQVTAAESRLAVLEKENEMMGKVTDINADIIDVKELVSQLIQKLPEININSLSVQSTPNAQQ